MLAASFGPVCSRPGTSAPHQRRCRHKHEPRPGRTAGDRPGRRRLRRRLRRAARVRRRGDQGWRSRQHPSRSGGPLARLSCLSGGLRRTARGNPTVRRRKSCLALVHRTVPEGTMWVRIDEITFAAASTDAVIGHVRDTAVMKHSGPGFRGFRLRRRPRQRARPRRVLLGQPGRGSRWWRRSRHGSHRCGRHDPDPVHRLRNVDRRRLTHLPSDQVNHHNDPLRADAVSTAPEPLGLKIRRTGGKTPCRYDANPRHNHRGCLAPRGTSPRKKRHGQRTDLAAVAVSREVPPW